MSSRPRSALEALSAAERAAVLDELLATRSDLRESAEGFAAGHRSTEDRSAVEGDVADALLELDIEELNGRAEPQPGRAYVHPSEAAEEILDKALQPFLDDNAAPRRARHELCGDRAGRRDPLGSVCVPWRWIRDRAGGIAGLRRRAGIGGSQQCRKLGIELPVAELRELMPEWDTLLR